jgi:hypothetical protein
MVTLTSWIGVITIRLQRHVYEGQRSFSTMNFSETPYYTYRPLDPLAAEIRLLRVLDISGPQGTIRCSLSSECLLPYGPVISLSLFPLLNRPRYRALSYVWGDSNDRTEILVDGCRLGITPNLDAAIRHLFIGGHLEPRVWIDSICVNQADKAERSSQVLLMRRLYQNAERVVVWLGTYPAIQGQDKTFELIRDLTHDQEETSISIQDEEDATTWQPTGPALANFQEKLGDKSLIWVAEMIEEDLFERHAWWKRMWVVQEIAVSTRATVHRGNQHVRWSDITRVTRWLNREDHDIQARGILRSILNLVFIQVRWVRGESMTLHELLAACHDKGSTDPRDKIFAILGLVSGRGELFSDLCTPDYAMPISHVLARTALYIIATDRSLNCILRSTPRISDLPSWVPDFSTTSLLDGVDGVWDASRTVSFHLRAPEKLDEEQLWRRLHVSCIIIDAVVDVNLPETSPFGSSGYLKSWQEVMETRYGNPFSTRWSFSMRDIMAIINRYKAIYNGSRPYPDFRPSLAEMRRSRVRFDEPYVGGATVLEAWVRTLIADQIYPGKRVTDEQIIAFCQCRYPPTFLQAHEPKERFKRFFGTLARAFIYGIRNKRLVMTKRGYIGTVPTEVKVGDCICILAGCDVPVMLRKKESFGDNTYILVSDAYIHGIMDGEVSQLLDKNIVSINSIVLE